MLDDIANGPLHQFQGKAQLDDDLQDVLFEVQFALDAGASQKKRITSPL